MKVKNMRSLLILNGPNLNFLGRRQPDIYGITTLKDIEGLCATHAQALGIMIVCQQSNHEGTLIDAIHQAEQTHDGLIINAGAYTHTSIALMDAITAVGLPTVEVHMSNIHRREEYRHSSYIAQVAVGQICGFGATGYVLAMDALCAHLKTIM